MYIRVGYFVALKWMSFAFFMIAILFATQSHARDLRLEEIAGKYTVKGDFTKNVWISILPSGLTKIKNTEKKIMIECLGHGEMSDGHLITPMEFCQGINTFEQNIDFSEFKKNGDFEVTLKADSEVFWNPKTQRLTFTKAKKDE